MASESASAPRRRLLEPCAIGECPNYAQPGKALCHAHQKRKARGQDLLTPVKSRNETPLARLQRAAIAYGEADTTSDVLFRRALHNLKSAARAWVDSLPRPEFSVEGVLTGAEGEAFKAQLRAELEESRYPLPTPR
jgi:hypothetical protein